MKQPDKKAPHGSGGAAAHKPVNKAAPQAKNTSVKGKTQPPAAKHAAGSAKPTRKAPIGGLYTGPTSTDSKSTVNRASANTPVAPKPSPTGGLYTAPEKPRAKKAAGSPKHALSGGQHAQPAPAAVPAKPTATPKAAPAQVDKAVAHAASSRAAVSKPATAKAAHAKPAASQLSTKSVTTAKDKQPVRLADASHTDVDEPRYKSPEANRQIKITEKAINKVVGQAIRSVPGVVVVDGGVEKMTGRSFPRYDLKLDPDGSAVSVDASIAVGWPCPVTLVAQKVRQTIITWVSDMTDVPVTQADVTVGLVEPNHERTTAAQLESFDMHPVLAPVTVKADTQRVPIVVTSINDDVASIAAPRPRALAPINAGHIPDAVSPSVQPPVELAPIDAGTLPEVRHVKTPAPIELASINAGTLPEVRHVETPAPIELAPIDAGTLPEVRHVETPAPLELSAVSVEDQAPLATIGDVEDHVLAPITVEPTSVRDIEAPRPQALAPVTTPKPRRLANIYVEPTRLADVDEPRPQPLAKITVDPSPLTRIPEPVSHRLEKTPVPTPPRLEDISVHPVAMRRVEEPRPHRLARVQAPDKHLVAHPKPPKEKRLARVVTRATRVQSTPRVEARPLARIRVSSRELTPITVRRKTITPVSVVRKK